MYSFDGRKKEVPVVKPVTVNEKGFSAADVQFFLRAEIRSMKYITVHSKHTTTDFGPAPNESMSTRMNEVSERVLAKKVML